MCAINIQHNGLAGRVVLGGRVILGNHIEFSRIEPNLSIGGRVVLG